MKKLNITKERFEKSRYFMRKYGTLEYVSESGKVYKTSKGKLLKFNEGSDDDFEINENGVLLDYKGAGGDVVIPDGVTYIASYAFGYRRKITSVIIPDSVINMGEGAFTDCHQLQELRLGNGIKYIGHTSFSSCDKLTHVEIPDSVVEIKYGAFDRCYGLKSVTIGKNVKSINPSAFYACDNLTKITIPENVESIGDNAFSRCSSLKEVIIMGNPEIADNAFDDDSIIRYGGKMDESSTNVNEADDQDIDVAFKEGVRKCAQKIDNCINSLLDYYTVPVFKSQSEEFRTAFEALITPEIKGYVNTLLQTKDA